MISQIYAKNMQIKPLFEKKIIKNTHLNNLTLTKKSFFYTQIQI
jgi:hypothetical protein